MLVSVRRVVVGCPAFSTSPPAEDAISMSQSVAQTATVKPEAFDFGTAAGGKVGMWIFLITDGMGFAGLLLAYGIPRAGSHYWPDPSEPLGINFTAVMTFVLICSSVS